MFGNNKHRVVFIRKDFSIVSDDRVDPKRSPVPRVDELVVFEEEYYRVINVIHSPKDMVSWLVVEELEGFRTQKSEGE